MKEGLKRRIVMSAAVVLGIGGWYTLFSLSPILAFRKRVADAQNIVAFGSAVRNGKQEQIQISSSNKTMINKMSAMLARRAAGRIVRTWPRDQGLATALNLQVSSVHSGKTNFLFSVLASDLLFISTNRYVEVSGPLNEDVIHMLLDSENATR